MPEGPEIRRAADKIEAVLRNKTVEALEFGLEPLKRFAGPLEGSKVLALEPRGKALLTHFDSGDTTRVVPGALQFRLVGHTNRTYLQCLDGQGLSRLPMGTGLWR